MKKRTIGGVGFVLLFYISLLSEPLFGILLAVFLIAGLFELGNIYKKTVAKKQTIVYGITFLLFILSLGYLSVIKIPLVIYITALLMLDDTLAYAVGRAIGKHKLCKISPNKTIEGSLGGLILSPFVTIGVMSLVTFIFSGLTIPFITFDLSMIGDYNPFASLTTLIIISFFLAAVAQIGDLTESWFKRSAGIKDSGKIVYGHGGILDRVDSWIFPMILMAVIMLII